MPLQQSPPTDPEGLEAYFTDVEHLREAFRALVAAPALLRRLLVVHGVGGVGKSSLLRMFHLHCKSARVPAALASGDEAKSAVDVLSDWAADLKADGIRLATFAKTSEHYRAIQAKVQEQARKTQDARGKTAETLGKAAAKAAETAAGALVGAAVGSIIPGIGSIAGALGGAGAEALIDWLRGFLSRSDVDLLLDPTKRLTDDFLEDIVQVAQKQRLALMLDTFEQMTALEDWVRDLAQRLNSNVLLVIAGRAMPNWSRQWPGWMAQAQVEELRPMTEEVMRELVGRYHATIRGDAPNPVQVEAIIRFARGLPIVVTSAVRLWVQYGVEDFQAVKPQVVADLVDRLLEGVPPGLVPALESAAVVRWFNKEILRAVTGQPDVNVVYDDLRRFPFVRPRVEGLALHDAVREILDENLRVHDPERYRELHERAAAYFEARLVKATGQEAERLRLERLYHRIRADEENGIKSFQEMAEELVRYRMVNRLRALLNDMNSYPLEGENNQLWREYYNARLMHLEARLADAEKIYQAIVGNEQIEPKLRAYVLCDLGGILVRVERLGQINDVDLAFSVIKQSLDVYKLDSKLVANFLNLRRVYLHLGEWERAIESLTQAQNFSAESGDQYRLTRVYDAIKSLHARRGDWKNMYAMQRLGLHTIPMTAEHSSLRISLLATWTIGYTWSGRYIEAEKNLKEALKIAQQIGDAEILGFYWDLGLTVGLQAKYDEANNYFDNGLEIARTLLKESWGEAVILGFRGKVLLNRGSLEQAENHLLQSLDIKRAGQNYAGFGEILNWLGELHEVQRSWDRAESDYRQSLEVRWTGRRYFECAALTGLARVKHAQADYAAIPPLLAEAEALAQQYEYNDHLASLRLTQGHIAWQGHIPEWGDGFDAALRYYRQALIFALRYNRFMLDEVLWGGGVCTPLHPIIPHCLERGDEGRRMLIALRDWWRAGANDIGAPRPDTISPIPEGIPLPEAERIAREREPGDGRPQKVLVERIEATLQGDMLSTTVS